MPVELNDLKESAKIQAFILKYCKIVDAKVVYFMMTYLTWETQAESYCPAFDQGIC